MDMSLGRTGSLLSMPLAAGDLTQDFQIGFQTWSNPFDLHKSAEASSQPSYEGEPSTTPALPRSHRFGSPKEPGTPRVSSLNKMTSEDVSFSRNVPDKGIGPKY